MIQIYTGFYFVIAIASIILGVRHTLHMFQLNSYQYQAQGRYLRTHKLQALYPVLGVAAFVLVAVQVVYVSVGLTIGMWIFGGIYLVGILFIYRPRKAKKKLVITARVKRLIATTAVISIVLFICVAVWIGDWWWGGFAAAMLVAALGSYLVLLANLCNIPIEKAINNYYINDARRMLKECPDLKIIGITGSYGKTSVKYYLHTLLSAGFEVLMTPESYNTPMGVVKTIRGSLKATHEVFLCEMGARHVGDIKEICDIVDPQMGIITSLGYQHLETFHSLDNIVGTKKELFDALPQGGVRYINGDNEFVRKYQLIQGAVTYGLLEDNDYRAYDLNYSEKGSTFKVKAPDGSVAEYTTKMLGEHNVVNITGAIAIAHDMGISLEKLKLPVRRLEGAPHRLQPIAKNSKLTIIDDAYNSNPNGTKVALKTLSMFEGVKVLVTPGMVELGSEEDKCNFEFGAEAGKVCDYIVLVGQKQTKSLEQGVRSTDFATEKLYVAENLQDALNYVYGIVSEQKLIVLLENDLPDNYL
ncbi:MAG: UDP-N-acetylmuramoyl-tripeptide--D-alanyl-D-alanine ligase [Lachnospiraceae bacterium]|nr:UDP-N-acetylmuramoyl-tripeptide--D-alanyl-D-alanine ligase [Lachnospiraceae bacterium]